MNSWKVFSFFGLFCFIFIFYLFFKLINFTLQYCGKYFLPPASSRGIFSAKSCRDG